MFEMPPNLLFGKSGVALGDLWWNFFVRVWVWRQIEDRINTVIVHFLICYNSSANEYHVLKMDD